MKCPNDGATLQMSDRQGVEIDYCPECRGVWLDRGELDKIIDKSSAIETKFINDKNYERNEYADRRDDYQGDRNYSQPYHKKKKREGFLSDLFDFGD